MKKISLILTTLILGIFSFTVRAQESFNTVDLGLSVKWADKDINPESEIPEGWRMPTLAEIKELRESCTQSVQRIDNQDWIVFTGKNGSNVSFLWPMGSRSGRSFGIAGEDGCYLQFINYNPILNTPNKDGYFSWEELGDTSYKQRKFPVRLVKE